ncbi:hypothetical protein [Rhodanobacter sp. A1T4]|uniref:hypothetical protein n=1 Tax=Rhodanobacter sp. A1T4 TaxID=2723087 RepID=UPI0016150CDB|nr:hypothetical protein [Rhodanobacter sp. A1T4]MBB6249394.1 hypothetical protein [Rhodanobacter sp. A1T4]
MLLTVWGWLQLPTFCLLQSSCSNCNEGHANATKGQLFAKNGGGEKHAATRQK